MLDVKKQLAQFSMVGAANFFLTFCIFYGLLKLGTHYLIALSAAWIIGNIFTYVFNFVWVFRPEEKLEFRKRLPKYMLANGASFALNLLLLNLIVELSGWDPFYVQIFLVPLVVIINFLTSRFWSMRPEIS